jgi:ankyrin repeat protein
VKETLRLLQLQFVNLLGLLLQYDDSFARTRIGSSALHYTVESNDFDNVELLIDSRADVNISDCDGTEKQTILQKAVNNHHVMIVKVILEAMQFRSKKVPLPFKWQLESHRARL